MNSLACLLSSAIVLCASAFTPGAVQAQASADARVSATIVTPVTISQESGQLEIGNPGTTAIQARTGNTIRESGTTEAPKVSAEFSITGSPAYAYSVSVPDYVSVVHGNKIITLATDARIASGAPKLSTIGTASVSVEGIVISTEISKNEVLFASNTDDEDYVRNGLPITINNN